MVKVKEITPIKLSGLSSFLVEFGYSQEMVSLMKSFRPAVYHKKLKAWEIPAVYLSKLLDEVAMRDEIELTTKGDSEIREISLPPLSEGETASFKVKPYPHQTEAVDFMLRQGKSLLLDSMGLGKTAEMIWYAETLHRRGLIDHCLIVCGVNSVKLNFLKEIRRFSGESVRVLGMKVSKNGKVSYAMIPERVKELKSPIGEFFVITNIETLRNDSVVEAISKGANRFGLICVDECHRALGNTQSSQASNLRKLKADYKVAATGTLITNNPMSAYGSLSWTENDHATLTNFKAQYCDFGGFNGYQVVGYHDLGVLQEEIDACSIRRTFDQVRGDMPEKTVEFELVEMDEARKRFYEAIKEGVKEEADKVDLKANNLLALTTRLRQATASPGSLTSNPIESAKVERCAELVEELTSQGEKVVVLSTFIEPAHRLAELLKGIRLSVNAGDIGDDELSANVDRFQNDPKEMVFIGTHAKAGTGLSLPAARYMIMIDTPWTYSQFGQSCDRIYRITSGKSVYIKVLACAGTIDERVIEVVENKKELSDYLVDGKLSGGLADEMRSIIRDL